MKSINKLYSLKSVIKKEQELISKRREALNLENTKDCLGIALSGGGIRSATFNLGLLSSFNKAGLLKRTDYISSVSGGGYINSFIQKRLYNESDFDTLFNRCELERLKNYGEYLIPGRGIRKLFEAITFYISFITLSLLHFIWYALFFVFVVLAIQAIFYLILPTSNQFLYDLIFIFLSISIWYYLFYPLKKYKYLWNERLFFYIFAILATILIIEGLNFEFVEHMKSLKKLDLIYYLIFSIFFLLMGYLANPNILSMHLYYNLKIKDAFLKGSNIKLSNLLQNGITKAPYPLFCSTLNIIGDDRLKGVKSADYYLLSPLYCGSKLTKYVNTDSILYRDMQLSTAVTISGAAINSVMGRYSNKLLSFILTILNIRLGYWARNPKILSGNRGLDRLARWFLDRDINFLPTYWPFYNFSELIGKMNLNRWMINLSDGGNIENLAAFELLRREVKVIICIDAGADPKYEFDDLKNLILRARNELEIAIEFDNSNRVEEIIKPKPSLGYSQRNYVVGRYYKLPKKGEQKEYLGYFIYIKPSLLAPMYKLDKETRSSVYYGYKNYHPKFPHETTIDQFFDADQWEAYKTLGQEIGDRFIKELSDVNSIKNIEKDLQKLLERIKIEYNRL